MTRTERRVLPDELQWNGLQDYLSLATWAHSLVTVGRGKNNRVLFNVTGALTGWVALRETDSADVSDVTVTDAGRHWLRRWQKDRDRRKRP